MSMQPLQDLSGLRWIRADLDSLIHSASAALDAFVEGEPNSLDDCIAYLRRIQGSLQMVQIYGGAMLVDELEHVACALGGNTLERRDTAAEVLMYGILQLSNYLEKVEAGQPDIPLGLLPLLNDLRAVRNAPLVSEIALFAPKLDAQIAAETVTPGSGNPDLPGIVKQQRANFHRGLLNWYRGLDTQQGLQQIGQVLERVVEQVRVPRLRRLLEASRALVIVLQEQDVDAGVAVKRLFGQLDRVLKQIIEQGEEVAVTHFPIELLKNQLYYVARSNSQHTVVQAVRQMTDEARDFPDLSAQDWLRYLEGPSKALLQVVADALREELHSIKEQIDLYMRGSRQGTSQLLPLAAPLQRIADTLGMLGRGELRTRLKRHLDTLFSPNQNENTAFTHEQLLAMAGELVYVESALSGLSDIPESDDNSDAKNQHNISHGLSTGELREVVEVAARETLVELAWVKEAIQNYLAAPSEVDGAQAVIGRVHKAAGALSVMQQPLAADLLDEVKTYIERLSSGKMTLAGQQQSDVLAELLSGVEYYIESVLQAHPDQANALQLAQEAAQRLQAMYVSIEDKVSVIKEAVTPQASVDKPALTGLDPDILDTFIEEAHEVLDVIHREYPHWRQDIHNQEALVTIRRSFHTLKGSGRLVGASEISELAWNMEDLLNRVIDNRIVANESVFNLLDKAIGILATLVEVREQYNQLQTSAGLTGQAAQGVSDQPPVAQAIDTQDTLANETGFFDLQIGDAIDDSLEIEEITLKQLENKPNKEASATHSVDQIPIALDDVLYDIFSQESQIHLDTIKATIENCQRADGHCAFDDQLKYALHTLCGSAHMAQVKPMAELSSALEKWVELCAQLNLTLEHERLALLARGHIVLHELLAVVNRPKPMPDWKLLYQEVHLQITHLEAQIQSQPAEPIQNRDDVDTFLEEADELSESLEQHYVAWSQDLHNIQPVIHLQRGLHTIKGGARLVGFVSIGSLSHAIESLLEGVVEQRVTVNAAVQSLIRQALDLFNQQIESVRLQQTMPDATPIIGRLEAFAKPDNEVETSSSQPIELPTQAGPETAAAPSTVVEHEATLGGRERIRIDADLIDRLVNNAGEISIYRARLEQQGRTLGLNLEELVQTIERLQAQLRNLEIETETEILSRYQREPIARDVVGFDPLELDRYSTIQQLSRALSETVGDLVNISGHLQDLNRDNDTLLLQQGRVSTDLQESLLRARLVPVDSTALRLQRVVRQIADELDKHAELEVIGGSGEMDRAILERMLAPLEHLLRNAVAHGIELPEERAQQGKKPVGRITLEVSREGSEVLLKVTDDGQGIDRAAIRAKAEARGLLMPGAEIDDADLDQLILEVGFSTVDKVSQIAGRGVGMDIVLNEIKQLGGHLSIHSVQGQGTTFSIRLPFTLTITEALMVELGEDVYAIPHGGMDSVVRASRDDIMALYNGQRDAFDYGGRQYQLRYLGNLLDSKKPTLPETQRWFPLLLIHSGDHRVAIHVDGLVGNRQIVVKSLGLQLNSVRAFTGGTVLPDGKVALILDIAYLTNRQTTQQHISLAEAPLATQKQPKVMVVDDSITVRKVTSRLLQRNNMQVLTARDGVDAIALLQDERPDLMLLDVEMPRMDGFELAKHMRSSEALKHIPIIMITSRSGTKHRDHAKDLGIKHYLGKPYQEVDLLENIHRVLAENT